MNDPAREHGKKRATSVLAPGNRPYKDHTISPRARKQTREKTHTNYARGKEKEWVLSETRAHPSK